METENPLADSDAEPSSPVAEDGEIVTGTAENKDAARSSKAWVVDDEAALMSEFNRSGGDLLRRDQTKQQNRAAHTQEFGGTVTGGRTTEQQIDPALIDLDEEESRRQAARLERMSGLTGMIRKWWELRQIENNKDYGMDPFIRARLGGQGKWRRTNCFLSTKHDGPDVYRNPKFNDTHDRVLRLKRSKADGGEVIVEAMDEEPENERFIGGCHVHLTEFIQHAELTTDWKHTMFHLYDRQQGEGEDDELSQERDAGGVHALVRWLPEVDERGMWVLDADKKARGELQIKVMSATELKDISGMKISDITSFADQTALDIVSTILVLFVMISVVNYRYMVWSDVDWGARDVDWPILDTLLFVVTTFTTVGFGNHPTIGSGEHRLATLLYVIGAIGILGVFIGAAGDVLQSNVAAKKKKKLRDKLREMEDRGEDIADLDGNEDDAEHLKQQAKDNLERRKRERALAGEDLHDPEHDPDNDLAMQLEIGRVLERHFWKDEARKAGWGFGGLVLTMALGTLIFAFTEREECYQTRLGSDRAMSLLGTMAEESSEWLKLRDEIENCTATGCSADPWRGECEKGYAEGLSVDGALYMTAVTASTVGYGDFTPQSTWGKIFAILYFPIAVALMSKTILTVSMIPTEYRKLKLESYVLDQFGDQLNAADLEDLRQSVNLGEGEGLHRNDFVLAMLLRLGRVSKVDLLRTEQIFFNLDKDHSGMIDKEDLKNLLATQRRRLQKARQESMLGTKHPVMPRHFTPKGHFLHVGGPTFDSEEKMAEHSGENLSSEIKAVHAPVQSSL